MVVICYIELYIPDAHSLKDKRHVVRSIMERIKSRCGASVAEVEYQDVWQRAALEVAIAGSDYKLLELQVERIRRIIDDIVEAETAVFEAEYI